MNKHTDETRDLGCRRARKLLHAGGSPAGEAIPASLGSHLKSCARCAQEHRVLSLSRAVLDLAAAPEPVRPEEDFYAALRARIERGRAEPRAFRAAQDDSWAAAVLLTARQLVPAMALLLMVIIVATLMMREPSAADQVAARPSDRVLFNDIYDYPAPTADDVLETLVAVEEKDNGK